MNMHLRFLLVSALALSLVSAGCGRKTNPIVPESPRPEAVRSVKAEARGTEAWLTWPIPERNVEGRSMKPADIEQFRVYRTEIGRDARRGRLKLLAEITLASPSPAVVRNNSVTWSDTNLRFGQTYGYSIQAVSSRGGRSRMSDEILVTPAPPLAVPQHVEAAGGDNYTVITWAAVTTWMDGRPAAPAARYNIYRGTERGRYDQAPLNRQPFAQPSFRDTTARNDHTYYYIVRSVAQEAPPWNESPDSAAVSATPRDRTPPDSPAGLTVLAGLNRVFLTWNENRESDLAGYHVYRAPGGTKSFVRLTTKPLTRTTFSDDTVKSGNTYHYAVTAVDTSGNESIRSVEKTTHVEVLHETTRPEDGRSMRQP
jgi:hypothetical protein